MNARGIDLLRCLALASALFTTAAKAETVDVEDFGPVDLKTFACTDVRKSKFFMRTCYDAAKRFMLIQMRDTYYPYCELPRNTYRDFLESRSMITYYNANIRGNIRGNGEDGPFGCRRHSKPEY